ncbi:MAG: alanine racemase [Kiritimatiellia bacterium]|nr:alanine racemase [Kiritimatiellia bacterium]
MYSSWVEIDADALRSNLRAVRAALPRATALMFVVKANAYGHDSRLVARTAAREGIDWFTVAHTREALTIRNDAGSARILVLGAPFAEEVPALLDHNVLSAVVSLDHARALAAKALRRKKRLPVHLKIDTGMGRMGLLWPSALAEASEILRLEGLDVQGICTHFARVEPGEDDPARIQMARFAEVADAVDRAAGRRLFRHVSNSRAILCRPEWDCDGVRPGILLYGYGASSETGRLRTHPVLHWKSRVVQARHVPADFPVGYYGTYRTPASTNLAVVGLGYADGYLRSLSNRSHVLIRGRRCRVVGRVSMNWIIVDTGPYGEVADGDEVVLIGRQGNQEIWADELAILCRTIPYEILTCIQGAIPRTLLGRGSPFSEEEFPSPARPRKKTGKRTKRKG